MRKITDYASREMKACPGVSESAALELLCSVSLWLEQWYKHCEEGGPRPAIQVSMKNVHELL